MVERSIGLQDANTKSLIHNPNSACAADVPENDVLVAWGIFLPHWMQEQVGISASHMQVTQSPG